MNNIVMHDTTTIESKIIDGKTVAAAIEAGIKTQAEQLVAERGITPGLAVVLVGNDPASATYVRSKGKACARLGFYSATHTLPEETSQGELLALIAELNADERVHGILVQSPMPKHINPDTVVLAIDPRKDVDGFHPANVGRLVIGLPSPEPCTPSGVIAMLKHYGIQTRGKRAVVVGRSMLVGKPLANMLLRKGEGGDAIVTVAHSAAEDLGSITRQADILVAAIGRPGYITASMVKPGAVVIDVGINRIEDPTAAKGYRIVGDVDFDSVAPVASAITPVPGGVGLMTIAMLMNNTLRSAQGAFD